MSKNKKDNHVKDIHLTELVGDWARLAGSIHMEEHEFGVRYGDAELDMRRVVMTRPSTALAIAENTGQKDSIVRVPYATAPAQLEACVGQTFRAGKVILFVNAEGGNVAGMVPATNHGEYITQGNRGRAANSSMRSKVAYA